MFFEERLMTLGSSPRKKTETKTANVFSLNFQK